MIDLVDNSLDGAQRTVTARHVPALDTDAQPQGSVGDSGEVNAQGQRTDIGQPTLVVEQAPSEDLTGFRVELTLNADELSVEDNCGGIPFEIARDYAFRFGRDPKAPPTASSIGQFGVGMKRTIFKVGMRFSVRSTSSKSRFTMEQDVASWLSDAKNWNFDFAKLETELNIPEADTGTLLRVTELHPPVADLFGRISFLNELRDELEQAHATSIQRGFVISLNGVPIGIQEFKLLSSDRLAPAFIVLNIPPPDGKPHGVTVRIYAGLSAERSFEKGGWYVFCNGRQVLVADQSSTTGWTVEMEAGTSDKDGDRVPKYHADFAYFRGFVFFDSKDASQLPWTTTKTGVDADSAVFRAARREMMRVMRPITRFLRDLAVETSEEEQGVIAERPLNEALTMAQSVNYAEVNTQSGFVAPSRNIRTKRDTVKVQYTLARDRLERAKERLNALSAKQVGEQTFDYFYAAECE